MSRIGIQLIKLPETVKYTQEGQTVTLTGPKGQLALSIPSGISVKEKDGNLAVSRASDAQSHRALHGTIRSLLANMAKGVSEGFIKKLELVGIGYRAAIEADQLILQVGFTHPVKMTIPAGIEAKVEKNTISLSGIDRQVVGQFAANVRDVRRPEPYKGKGIRYSGELVRMKQGKAVKAGA